MIKVFLVIILAVLCTASIVIPVSVFHRNLDALKNALSTGADINPILQNFNDDTYHFSRQVISPTQAEYKEYVKIKCKAVEMLCTTPSVDFNSSEIVNFSNLLVEDGTRFESFFPEKRLQHVISFLTRTTTKSNQTKTLRFAASLVKYMKPENLSLIDLGSNKRTSTTTDPILEKIKSFKTAKLEEMFPLLIEIADTEINVIAAIELAKILSQFDFRGRNECLNVALEIFKKIMPRYMDSGYFMTNATDFVLSEHVIAAVSELGSQNRTYSVLLYLLSKYPYHYRTKLSKLSIDSRDQLNMYQDVIEKISNIFELLDIIKTIDHSSGVFEFDRAIRSANQLLKLKLEDEFVKEVLKYEIESLSSSCLKYSVLLNYRNQEYLARFMNKKGNLYIMGWKLSCIVNIICHGVVEGARNVEFRTNIVTGMGQLLLAYPQNSPDYPAELIAIIFPHIDDIIEGCYTLMSSCRSNYHIAQFKAVIKFCQLHPNQEIADKYINLFAYHYITTIQPDYNRFDSIRELQIPDPIGVYKRSFRVHLENYINNPNAAHQAYLREFYLFLRNSEFLDKTEILFFKTYFKEFAGRVNHK